MVDKNKKEKKIVINFFPITLNVSFFNFRCVLLVLCCGFQFYKADNNMFRAGYTLLTMDNDQSISSGDNNDMSDSSDSDFSRPIYSLQEVSEGALGDIIVFNSIKIVDTDYEWYKNVNGTEITSGTLLNETDFVGAREDTGINADPKNVWNDNDIIAEDGKTYIVRLYVHNNSPLGETATAEDVKVRFDVPVASDTEVKVNGWLNASNANPDTYMDDVTFKSSNGKPFHLEYVYGTALLENSGFANSQSQGATLPDSVVNQGNPSGEIDDTWTLIGYESLDGMIPGGYAYINYVTIKVKVVYEYDFTTATKVRLADSDDKNWKDTVEARVGDKVEFQIAYNNISETQQANVVVQDVLPPNLRYIAGSTMIKNSTYPDGTSIIEDYLVTDGIRIGTYAKNSKAYIFFTAEVVDDDLAYGSNTLVNWGRVTVDQKVLQDDTYVTVYKDS